VRLHLLTACFLVACLLLCRTDTRSKLLGLLLGIAGLCDLYILILEMGGTLLR
jgi:hypothetical protein